MVGRFQLLTALLSLLMLSFTAQAEELHAEVSLAEKQWGQYMRVTLSYIGDDKLEQINLDEWRSVAAVFIEDEYTDQDDNGREVQIMKLRLYPRSIGEHVLPPLTLGKASSQPLVIQATPPHVEESDIHVDWKIDKATAWQREATSITVKVTTEDYAARIQLDPIVNSGFISKNIKPETSKIGNKYIHTAGWIIYPLLSGPTNLELPPIRYQLSGSDRRRFYLPRMKLNVSALPTYIPPTLPVGSLNISSRIVNNDKPYWEIRLSGTTLVPYGLPGLDKQLTEISGTDITDIKIDSENENNTVRYQAELPDWLFPWSKNTVLSSRYFDTQSGKISTIHHTLPLSWRIPVWARITGLLFLFTLGFIMARKIHPVLLVYINRQKLRKKIQQAETADEIRQLLLSSTHAVTLTAWASENTRRIHCAGRLNQYCYSRNKDSELLQLRQEISTVI